MAHSSYHYLRIVLGLVNKGKHRKALSKRTNEKRKESKNAERASLCKEKRKKEKGERKEAKVTAISKEFPSLLPLQKQLILTIKNETKRKEKKGKELNFKSKQNSFC